MGLRKTVSRRRFVVAGAVVTAVGATNAGARQAASPVPRAATPAATPVTSDDPADQRAERVLRQMTLEEKIALTHGETNPNYPFYRPPLRRLGIPALSMADGPSGVRVVDSLANGGRATAMPATIALAATWDETLARRYGDLVGREAWNTGHNVQLGPGADIARVPVAGRIFESFGEDPLLSGRCAAAYVSGVQAHPVAACVKHYCANNQEADRTRIDAQVSERALQEIYVPPFAAAVQQGGVGIVMGSFNQVNGAYACENPQLLTDILKRQLGFEGFVISDWAAAHDTVTSANAGLDQEQPSARVFGDALLAAVQTGAVPIDRLDDMARRILRTMFALGLVDQPVEIAPLPEREHGQVAREIAAQGIVLLKNTEGVLPLPVSAVRRIAVIGADADNASAAGGGSGLVAPAYTVSPLEAIRQRVGSGVAIEHAPGTDPVSAAALLPGPQPVPSSVLTPPDAEPGSQGLRAEYWDNPTFAGEPALARTDPHVDLNFGFFVYAGFNAGSPNLPPIPAPPIAGPGALPSARWTGTLTAPATGEYTLALTSLGTSRLELDGRETIANLGIDLTPATATVSLVAGEPHEVRVEYAADAAGISGNIGAQMRFGWEPPAAAIPPQVREAADLAGRSDVAVVVVRDYESEEMDRPDLRLPNEQDQLIRAVAAANPKTIAVVQTGAAVAMPWLDDVGAVVQAWYGGQEQGNAIADILFGGVNPSGKLPLTFPHAADMTPIRTAAQYPGVMGIVEYSEDVFVGYRGYEHFGIEPLFPFGHGLSYTTFDYADLWVEIVGASTGDPSQAGATDETGTAARIRFTLMNSGEVAGAEVAQVYVGRLPGEVATAPKQLAGFVKVALDPGQHQDIIIDLPRSAVSYWDSGRQGWTTPAGEIPVCVGSSSRDIRLEGTLEIA